MMKACFPHLVKCQKDVSSKIGYQYLKYRHTELYVSHLYTEERNKIKWSPPQTNSIKMKFYFRHSDHNILSVLLKVFHCLLVLLRQISFKKK